MTGYSSGVESKFSTWDSSPLMELESKSFDYVTIILLWLYTPPKASFSNCDLALLFQETSSVTLSLSSNWAQPVVSTCKNSKAGQQRTIFLCAVISSPGITSGFALPLPLRPHLIAGSVFFLLQLWPGVVLVSQCSQFLGFTCSFLGPFIWSELFKGSFITSLHKDMSFQCYCLLLEPDWYQTL